MSSRIFDAAGIEIARADIELIRTSNLRTFYTNQTHIADPESMPDVQLKNIKWATGVRDRGLVLPGAGHEKENLRIVLAALVNQMGGYVSLTTREVEKAIDYTLESFEERDPFRLILKVKE